jgi:cyanophycinase-like exopeptidase
LGVAMAGTSPGRALFSLKMAESHCAREYVPKLTDISMLLFVCTALKLLVMLVDKLFDVSVTV